VCKDLYMIGYYMLLHFNYSKKCSKNTFNMTTNLQSIFVNMSDETKPWSLVPERLCQGK
jgi:hypothetical protein